MIQDKVVIGTWPLSGAYGRVDLKTVQSTLECCYYNNFKEFDVAPNYGEGFIEFCISKVFGDKSDILINTKIGNMPFSDKSFKVVDLRKSLDQSLKRLSLDSLNILFLHNPRNDIDDPNGVLEFMKMLKKDGKIKHIGISLAKNYKYDLNFLQEFDVIQDDGNLLDMRFHDLQLADGASFMARSPLASGILSGKIGRESVFPINDHRSGWLKGERLESIMKRVDAIKKVSNFELIDLAKEFVLANDKIDKVIFGVKSPAHVESITGSKKELFFNKEIEEKLRMLYQNDFGLIDEGHLAL